MKALKAMAGQKETQSSANVVDGKLILSFPKAKTPVVWQMDLNEVKTAALEISSDSETGHHALVVKTPKDNGKTETTDVALFSSHDDAVHGLMMISKALENAHGQIAPSTAQGQPVTTIASAKKGKPWLGIVAGLVLIFILFNLWVAMGPSAPQSFQQNIAASNEAQIPSAADSQGVPVSADDFLNSL